MQEARLAVYAVLARAGLLVMSESHTLKFAQRGISSDMVADAITSATAAIIDTRDDARGPVSLVLGHVAGRPLHIALAQPKPEVLLVVTAYWPDERPRHWTADFRRRLP